MKTFKLTLFVMLLALIISSCSHTNNFSQYNMAKSKVLFEKAFGSDINKVHQYSSNTHSKKESDAEFFSRTALSIGSAFIGNDIEDKFTKAVNPDSIASAISQGVENTLIKYFQIQTESDVAGEYDYICIVALDKCEITSGSAGVYLNVGATTRITDRKTGGIVWEDSENENIQLRFSTTNYNSKSGLERTLNDATQVAMLASLTEDEIRKAVRNASSEVSRLFCQTIQEDFMEMNKKK